MSVLVRKRLVCWFGLRLHEETILLERFSVHIAIDHLGLEVIDLLLSLENSHDTFILALLKLEVADEDVEDELSGTSVLLAVSADDCRNHILRQHFLQLEGLLEQRHFKSV